MSDLMMSRCPRCGAIDSVQDERCTVCGTGIPAQRDLPWQVVLIESGDGARGYRISRYLVGLGLTKNEIASALRSLPSRVTPALPSAKAIAVLDYLESLGAQARIEVAPRPAEADLTSLPPPAQNRSLLPRALSPILFLGLLFGLLLVLASQTAHLGTSVLSGDGTVANVLRTVAGTVQEIGLDADDLSAAQAFLPEDVRGELDSSASLEIVSRNQIDSETYELNQEGVRLFKEGDADAALAKLEDAYARRPDNRMIAGNLSNVLTYIGWSNVKAKEFDDALQRFDRALGANQENVEALKGAGFSKIQLKETDAAVRDFEDAYRLAPADADLALTLARLLHRSDRIDQATTVLNTLLKEQPRNEKAKKLLVRIRREESVERGFMASDTGHFRLKFDVTENAGFGSLVSAILEEAYSLIGSQFHYYPSDPVVVILYTKEEFRAVSGLPHWSRGAYDGKIRIPVGGVNERTEELEDVIYHEYTHVVVNQVSGGRCPTWLNEGLAQYNEPSTEGEKRALLRMLRRQELAPLSSLEGSFLKLPGDQARFAYAEAYAVVFYIAETYSFYHLRLILEEIGNGLSPEGALQKILHFGYDDLLSGVAGYIHRG